MKMTYLMTRLVWKVFISSKPSRYPSCPPLRGHFSIQENAVGALSYKVKKSLTAQETREGGLATAPHIKRVAQKLK